MRNRNLILFTALIASLATPGLTQNKTGGKQGSRSIPTETISEDLLVLLRVTPKNMSVTQLYELGSQLWGRRFMVARIGGTRSNLLVTGNTLLIHDTEERAVRIHKNLTTLDAEAEQGKQQGGDLTTEVIPLQYVNVNDMTNALTSYRRSVNLYKNGQASRINTLAASQQTNSLIVRDTSENISAIKKVVARLDKPAPKARNLMLQALVIQGNKDPGGTLPVPEELKRGLSKLVPYPHFRTLGMGIVNCKVSDGADARLGVDLGTGSSCTLELKDMQINGGNLDIGALQCRLVMRTPIDGKQPNGPANTSGQDLNTSLSAELGGYTVLGAMGQNPYFIVLKVTPSN